MIRQAALISPVLALLIAASAFAVQPSEWIHRTEADFSAGDRDGTVVTNLGEVRLAQQTRLITSLADDALIYDIVQLDDGRVFVAVGPEARLAQLVDESLETVETFEDSQIFALTTDGESLWVGISGAQSHLERRTGEDMAVAQRVALPETRYIWDMLLTNDRLYAATGTDGTLFAIDYAPDEPVVEVALDADPSNILTIAADGNGQVYAGTDGEGLVYRLTQRPDGTYQPFIIYDAPEPEIGALLVLADGTVYAGTADADQARPGRLEAAREDTSGRPESMEPAEDEPAEDPDGDADLPDAPPAPPAPEPQDDAEVEGEDEAEDADTDAADETAAPTAEQYDALRDIVSERLSDARESGAVPMQEMPEPSARPAQTRRNGGGTASRASASSGSRQGNAIYRISPDGFVHELFRESVMILNIMQQNGALLVATGNEGQIYRLDPETEEVAILTDLDSQQIPALFKTAEGNVLLGAANPGILYELQSDFVTQGSLTSEPLDADQISLWGKLHLKAENLEETAVEVRTRTGNVADPDLGTWSPWSAPQQVEFVGGRSAYLDVPSPSARFIQYQLTLRSANGATPTVYQVALRYLMPNLSPRLASLKADYTQAGGRAGQPNQAPQARTTLKVEWEASDPNEDRLSYRLEAKPFGTDDPYITIAEDITETSYDWDTRTVPDGRYVLRVTASDQLDNVPDQAMTTTRRSDPVTIDNTMPEVHDFAVAVGENGQAVLTARITNALSPIQEVRYRVSGNEDWNMVLPEDMIYDSTEETIRVTIPDLAPGTKVLSLRASDAQGNTRHVSRTFSVPR